MQSDIEAIRVIRFVCGDRLPGNVPIYSPLRKSREKRITTLASPPHRRTHPYIGKPSVVLIALFANRLEGESTTLFVVALTTQLANELRLAVFTTSEYTRGIGGYEGLHAPLRQCSEPPGHRVRTGGEIRALAAPHGSSDVESDESNAFAGLAVAIAWRPQRRSVIFRRRIPRGTGSFEGVPPCENRNARSDGCVRAYGLDFDRMIRIDSFSAWRIGTCGARHADRTSYARPYAGRESENRLPEASVSALRRT